MRAGYRGDLAALSRVADRAIKLAQEPRIGAVAHYWAGYALWQRAINGVNRNQPSSTVEADVHSSLAQFRSALSQQEDFADAHAVVGLLEGWLTLLDSAHVREHATEARAHIAKAKALEPNNPRVVWAAATALLGTPRQFGGDPDRALMLFEEVAKMKTTPSPVHPTWGVPEAFMSKAFALMNAPNGDLTEAQSAANEALRQETDWYYVRDILLPMIFRKRQAGATPNPVTMGVCTAQGDATLNEMRDAVNAGDAERYANTYRSDAVITVQGGPQLVGRDRIEAYEVELLRLYPGTRFEFFEVWHADDVSVVRYGVNTPMPSGNVVGHEGMFFARFRDGQIAVEHRYFDSMTPMAQLRVPAEARRAPTLPTEPRTHFATATADEEENVALVLRSIAAFDANNEDTLIAAFAPEAFVDELAATGPCTDRSGVRLWLEVWRQTLPEPTTAVTFIRGVGDFVLLESTLRGTGDVNESARESQVLHRAAIARLENRKIRSLEIFMNRKELTGRSDTPIWTICKAP